MMLRKSLFCLTSSSTRGFLSILGASVTDAHFFFCPRVSFWFLFEKFGPYVAEGCRVHSEMSLCLVVSTAKSKRTCHKFPSEI